MFWGVKSHGELKTLIKVYLSSSWTAVFLLQCHIFGVGEQISTVKDKIVYRLIVFLQQKTKIIKVNHNEKSIDNGTFRLRTDCRLRERRSHKDLP